MRILKTILVLLIFIVQNDDVGAQDIFYENIIDQQQNTRNAIQNITPNPIENLFKLNLEDFNIINEILELRIINIVGNTVRKIEITQKTSTHDISDLASGPYIASVYINGRHNDSQRIIKN